MHADGIWPYINEEDKQRGATPDQGACTVTAYLGQSLRVRIASQPIWEVFPPHSSIHETQMTCLNYVTASHDCLVSYGPSDGRVVCAFTQLPFVLLIFRASW